MLSDALLVKAMASGFMLGLGFFFSVGPQNLQLIRAGAMESHAATVATTGYISEIIIVVLGAVGLSASLAPSM
jgi:L-lysine exporter family protein LysE/ArgO